MMEASLEDVKKFWNANPLFTGEAQMDQHFFARHDRAYFDDVFAGIDIEKTFYLPNPADFTLDLGCGIGFWTTLFHRRGTQRIVAADLSEQSLQLAEKRLAGASGIAFQIENAEALTFPNATFDHCNCQGVIHHTPHTDTAMREIARVLKPGATASVSVYYENFLIRHYAIFKTPIKIIFALLGKNLGRGRRFNVPDNKADIVRMYDGADNPIGKSYSKSELLALCAQAGFHDVQIRYFFFPARFLKIPTPSWLRALLVKTLPFMIVANCRK